MKMENVQHNGKNGTYICNKCKKQFIGTASYAVHSSWCGKKPGERVSGFKGKKSYRKGKTYEEIFGEEKSKKIKNKIAIVTSRTKLGKPLSEKNKNGISKGMKKAHAEGRAWHWNDGKGRKQSYPEKFFTKAIENEFVDKNYKKEHKVGKYWIDFAWLYKFIAIEIDGCQHERQDCKIYDQKRDDFLRSKSWKVLRIKWKDMYNNPQYWIQIAKDFVDNAIDRSEEIKHYQKQKRRKHLTILFAKINKRTNKKTSRNDFLIEKQKQLTESDINLTKFGCVNEVAKLWQVSHTQAGRLLRLLNIDYFKKKMFV